MKFNSHISNDRKLVMYNEAQNRLEESILRVLLEQGILPDEFDDESFIVENDAQGNPIMWQVDLKNRINGLNKVNQLISRLDA